MPTHLVSANPCSVQFASTSISQIKPSEVSRHTPDNASVYIFKLVYFVLRNWSVQTPKLGFIHCVAYL